MAVEINSRTGNARMVPALRFIKWKEAEQYFRAKEADEDTISKTCAALSRAGVAVMTVV